MPIASLQTLDIIEALENFCASKRPPEHLLPMLDIGYSIDNQSILIFEIRPDYLNPKEKMELPLDKTTFVKSKEQWNIFWMRADLK